MTRSSSRRRGQLAGALLASGALLLTACGGDSEEPQAAGTKAPLFAKLPKRIQQAKKLKVGSNVAYAPVEFYDDDGETIIGLDPDLGEALGKKLGVSVEFTNLKFESLPTSMKSGRIDVMMSSMTDNTSRQKRADFVDYFKVGTSLLVKKGNPEHISTLDDLCGKTVSMQQGTTQEKVATEQKKKCAAKHKPLHVLALDEDTDALLQVKQGRAVADLNDYPVAEYNARTSGDGKDFETVGQQITPGLYGIGVGRKDTQLRDALRAALNSLIKDGGYTKIVKKWHLSQGAVDKATINAGK